MLLVVQSELFAEISCPLLSHFLGEQWEPGHNSWLKVNRLKVMQ